MKRGAQHNTLEDLRNVSAWVPVCCLPHLFGKHRNTVRRSLDSGRMTIHIINGVEFAELKEAETELSRLVGRPSGSRWFPSGK